MKIKTIVKNTDNVQQFDDEVNAALAEGWRLVKREVLPDMNYNATNWARRALYAELVQLDPVPEVAEPQPADPFDAVRAVRSFCLSVPAEVCQRGQCPLYAWCCQQEKCEDPAEWEVPEKEAPRD